MGTFHIIADSDEGDMATVLFNGGLATSDPVTAPVIVVGQVKHLNRVTWDTIKAKLEPRVSKEIWTAAVSSLSPSPTDSVSLYMNLATVAALPAKASRHNTQSRSHSITKIVKSLTAGSNECAVARAFSAYTRKTVGEPPSAQP